VGVDKMLNPKLRKFIEEENKYIDLLKSNPQYRLQGSQGNKVIVGIIKGDPKEYKVTDHLIFMGFNTWKDAYIQLTGCMS
jgi:hypothetical protein